MVQAPVRTLTLEDFLQLPETKPASEYINGQVIQKPMPKTDHGILQTDLAAAITAKLRPNKIGRAITELRCTFGGAQSSPILQCCHGPQFLDEKMEKRLLKNCLLHLIG